jgi:Phosphotransferase enzyme family
MVAPLDPLLAGRAPGRQRWDQVPASVKGTLAARLGSPPVSATASAGGFSPAFAGRVGLADGRAVFVKAIGPDERSGAPGGQAAYRREAEVTKALPPGPGRPALLDHWEVDGWVVLVLEHIPGRNPDLPWRSAELERVLDAIDRCSASLTPSPITAPAAATPGGDEHWAGLAGRPGGTAWLGRQSPWALGHLDELVRLETGSAEACAGASLLHFDLRADNILLTHGDVYFVDWPHARVGAPWADLAYFLPSVAMQGGPPPGDLFWAQPMSRGAARGAVARAVAGLAGFMMGNAAQPEPPGLNGLRRFQLAQGLEALRWLAPMLAP